MRHASAVVLASAALAVSAAPASAECIPSEIAALIEDFEGEICDDASACPCFDTADIDTADIDTALSGLDTYSYAWARRANGRVDQTSLRGDSWTCGPDGWSAPTVGFDVYGDETECGTDVTYSCETWNDTWQAAPYHAWAGGGTSGVLDSTADEFAVCEGILNDWIAANGTPSWSW